MSHQPSILTGHLLVVDDDHVQRLVIRNVAAKAGFDVHQASSTHEAEVRLRERDYDLIILDLSLGEGTGIEVLRHVAKARHKPAVIIASGHDDRTRDATMRFCRAVHVTCLGELRKPLDLEVLRTALTDYVAAPVHRTPKQKPTFTREALRQAIERGQITPVYQPKFALGTGQLVGAEALARWSYEGQEIPPEDFCGMAEEAGLSRVMTRNILRTACRDAASWTFAPDLTVAVNAPPSVLADLDFPDKVADVLQESKLAPERLIIEVVESGPSANRVEIADVLTRLRIKGVNLAIDDFGTGFSSLESLLNLPFSELKVDMGFVNECDHDPYARQIVKASIILGRQFGMKTVAEGIERTEVRDLLRAMGCDVGQGRIFAAPMDAAAFRRTYDRMRLTA